MTKLRGITWDHPRGYAPLHAASAIYRQQTGVQVDWAKRSLKDFGDAQLTELARDYDLLIISKHGHRLSVKDAVIGDTARRVVRPCKIPVMVVPLAK